MNTNKLKIVYRSNANVEEKKRNLREYAKAKRGEEVNRDVKENLLVENFFALLEKFGLAEKKSFFVYLSFSTEAPTDKLVQALLERGKEVYCPRVTAEKMEVVPLGDDFSLSSRGLREPVGQATDIDPDVLVIPLLAVDKQGNRLGYGKGYYDRFMKTSRGQRIAYCYHSQLVGDVPHAEHDEKVAFIVTEREILKV